MKIQLVEKKGCCSYMDHVNTLAENFGKDFYMNEVTIIYEIWLQNCKYFPHFYELRKSVC